MRRTNLYKWTRLALIAVLIIGSTTACHYKAGFQYKEENDTPGADSGTRRIMTTSDKSDSNNLMNPNPGGPGAGTTNPRDTAPAFKPAPVTTHPAR